jgi:hypothetical protein
MLNLPISRITEEVLVMDAISFIKESNHIEGIYREPTKAEIEEFHRFMALDEIAIRDMIQFVSVYQPGAELRERPGMNVRVGRHYHSRYLLACEGLESTREPFAFSVFERIFKEYGLPDTIRTDNGLPFSSPNALYGLSKLSVWWLRTGHWHRAHQARPCRHYSRT